MTDASVLIISFASFAILVLAWVLLPAKNEVKE